jgi:exodeoxyribonuclease V alpha subunit
VSEEIVEGTIVRVTFENDETGFRVVRVRPQASERGDGLLPFERRRANDDDLLTVVGRFPAVAPGETIRAIGKFERDPRHGPQLRAETVTTIDPTTAAGIERYLGGGAFRGIGKGIAKKIVKHFGPRTIQILDREPHRLREIVGLGGTRAEALGKTWKAQRAARERMVALAALEIPPALAQRILKRYGDRTLDVVRGEPYRLATEVWGVGFRSADAIAQRLGVAVDDPRRAEAGVLHTLQLFAEEGHTATPPALVVDRAARLLDPARDPANDARTPEPPEVRFLERATGAIAALLATGAIEEEQEGLIQPSLSAEESGIAAHVARLARAEGRPLGGASAAIARFERETGVTLAPAQRAAIETIARSKVAVVTGGPGVGKTTVVRAILALFSAPDGGPGLRVALAAPTGRAAKRMAEATGQNATTLHRLLEVDPRRNRFTRDETKPLDLDAVIVDESSMIDVALGHALVRAVPDPARLVFVGDVDQLPSVGPGSVLRDLIRAEVVPVARLDRVFRQAGGSQIVEAAHAILRGDEPRSSAALQPGMRVPAGELYVVERDGPEEAARTIVEIVEQRIPKAFGLDPRRDVQVLVPMVRGLVGTRALNGELQARLNPEGAELRRGTASFRVGDRVMQMRNDYDREIFNGDLGFVASLARARSDSDDDEADGGAPRGLIVRLEDGREVTAEDDELDELSLAYATTVHKAQGSEYPAVVFGLVNQHFVMLARKLLYTAVTRARRLVVIVGSKWALREAVRDARAQERRTTLERRLRARA